MIYQQERTEAGASGDDLGAPFSLPALSKSALTHHPQAGGDTAYGSRALSEGGPPGVPFLPNMDQMLPAACTSDGAMPMHRGLGGTLASNKLRRVYTGALLASQLGDALQWELNTD